MDDDICFAVLNVSHFPDTGKQTVLCLPAVLASRNFVLISLRFLQLLSLLQLMVNDTQIRLRASMMVVLFVGISLHCLRFQTIGTTFRQGVVNFSV